MNNTISNSTPTRISDHCITTEALDEHALTVVNTLLDAGFEAFLVGGCVRDLLCEEIPKDFDVATNATPEQIKELFRRARLVGRRFPIAHVRFGPNVIEVSTFRQGQIEQVETNDQGRIIKDRAFGSMAEDAFRRDFTINALYFDTARHEIVDYVDAMQDIANKQLRFIGEPTTRIVEDPVRILRAMRFAAKLGFDLDLDDIDFDDVAERLEEIPGARLFDEFQKMFLTGYAAEVWERLRVTPLVHSLFPTCDPDNPLVAAAMANTDRRIAEELPVTPAFLIGVILWEDFAARNRQDNPKNKPDICFEIAGDTLAIQQQHMTIPRRFAYFAREMWQLQNRLEERHPRSIQRVLHHKRFRAAFDLLMLRAEQDDSLRNKAKWWEEIQTLDSDAQKDMIAKIPQKRRRKRRKRNPQYDTSLPPYES